MKKKAFSTLALFLVLINCIVIYAHPGRTDSKGGHRVSATGEYHYHHGQPAHQHIGGVCPYDYETPKRTVSGSSSSSSSNLVSSTQASQNKTLNRITSTILTVLILAAITKIVYYVWAYKKHIKQEEEKRKAEALRIKTEFLSKYGGKSEVEILKMVNAPQGVSFDEKGLPVRYINGVNIYEMYSSYNSTKYHDRHCRYANTYNKTNLAYVYRSKAPCKVCRPYHEDMRWYWDYKSIMSRKEKYEKDNYI